VKDSANPIEQVDLLDLLAWDGACTFTKTGTKGQELYAVENATISLVDLPIGYGLDRLGLVVRDEYVYTTSRKSTPLSPPISMPSLSQATTPSEVPDVTALPELPRQRTPPFDATILLRSSVSSDDLAPGSGTAEPAHTSHVVDTTGSGTLLQRRSGRNRKMIGSSLHKEAL
jgi:hypothetical protein